jgi:hypothetical protein
MKVYVDANSFSAIDNLRIGVQESWRVCLRDASTVLTGIFRRSCWLPCKTRCVEGVGKLGRWWSDVADIDDKGPAALPT